MSKNKSKNLIQSIAGFAALLLAYFLPQYDTGDQILNALISFGAFAPLVMHLSALINTRLHWQDMKAYSVTALVSLSLGYVSYFGDFGFLASATSLWWHPIITSLGIMASAVLGFSHEKVKSALEFIFDYSYKRKHHVQSGSDS